MIKLRSVCVNIIISCFKVLFVTRVGPISILSMPVFWYSTPVVAEHRSKLLLHHKILEQVHQTGILNSYIVNVIWYFVDSCLWL